jgi:hypothetical protein
MATYSQIEKLLAQQAQTIKTELKKEVLETMVENVVTKVVAQLKTNIEEDVTKAIEPVKISQDKTEAEVARLRSDLATLASRMDGQEKEIRDGHSSPPAAQDPAAISQSAAGRGQRPAGEDQKIQNMFREANSTLTFSPMAEEDWKQLTARLVEEEQMDVKQAEMEAGYRMVEEYLAQEMRMKSEHVQDVMDLVETWWPKGKAGWNAMVVRFRDVDIVDWVLRGKAKMRRGVEGVNKPVVENWVPGGLYKRYNAVRSAAYRIRQRDGLRTRINFGTSDFTLVTRRDGKDHWSAPVALENLPDFLLSDTVAALAREQRSPTQAPGRARYGGTAPREKRTLEASPGLSPLRKEPRTNPEATGDGQGTEGSSEEQISGEDERDSDDETIKNNEDNITGRKKRTSRKETGV